MEGGGEGSGKALIRWCLRLRSERQEGASQGKTRERCDSGQENRQGQGSRQEQAGVFMVQPQQQQKAPRLCCAEQGAMACSGVKRCTLGQARWDHMLQIISILLNSIGSKKPLKGFNWGMAYICTISLWLVCGEWIVERQK